MRKMYSFTPTTPAWNAALQTHCNERVVAIQRLDTKQEDMSDIITRLPTEILSL